MGLILNRFLLLGFFIYIVLEGALRKWFFLELSNELFVLKYIILILLYSFLLGKHYFRHGLKKPVLMKSEALLLWGWLYIIVTNMIINGISFFAIVGLSYYLIMVPIIFVLPLIVTNVADIGRYCRAYFGLACLVSLLGVAQFYSPQDAIINRYAWDVTVLEVATLVQDKARITGTFSYITPYTVYLQFMSLVGLALLNLTHVWRVRILLSVGIALTFVSIAMSGSRAPLLLSAILAIPFLLDISRVLLRKSKDFFPLLLSLVFAGVLLFMFGNVFSMVLERNRMADDANSRMMGALVTPLNTLNRMDFVGTGIGSTFLGAHMLGGSQEAEFDEVSEDRVGVELGLFGYLFVLLFKVVFLAKSWGLYRNAVTRQIKTWALVSFAYQLSFIWAIPVYNSVAAAFYFASIGLYVLLRNEQSRLKKSRKPRLVVPSVLIELRHLPYAKLE